MGALSVALQQHGIDVKTTNELGLPGVSDEVQLTTAAHNGRVVVTNNIRDFTRLHNRWIREGLQHRGIVVFRQQEFSVGEIVRRLTHLCRTLNNDEMRAIALNG